MKKILICGSTGFIGKNVTLGLSKNKNYQIHAVRFNRRAYDTPKNVIWHRADLRNPNAVNKLTKNMDIVVQCAATTSGSKDIVSKPFIDSSSATWLPKNPDPPTIIARLLVFFLFIN